MSQFLIEAAVLSLRGFVGMLGSDVGPIVGYLAGCTPVLTRHVIGLTFGVTAVIGGFSGVCAARKVLRFDPLTPPRGE